MPLGYRGEGITYSAPMAASTTIAKGDVVAFDADSFLVRAPADEKNPVGVAAEGRASGLGEHPPLAFVKHGVAGVKATAAVRAGRAVKVGAAPGEVVEFGDQPVNEGGTATFTVHPNEKLGVALEDIAAGAVGDIFVGA